MLQPLLFVASIIAGIVPTLLYVWLVWKLDRYEKEPLRLLMAAFVWGAVPAIGLSLVAELSFGTPLAALSDSYRDVLSAALVAPPIEELAKALAVWAVFRLARAEFDGALDGIVYGSLVGFGFAMTENVFYFWGALGRESLGHWATVVAGRALVFGLNHAMFTSFTGIGFGMARYAQSRRAGRWWILGGFGLAVVSHAVHNLFLHVDDLCLISLIADWAGVIVVLVVAGLALRHERGWVAKHLTEEVACGVLSPELMATVSSRRRRWQRPLESLANGGLHQAQEWRHLLQAATELAIKKHQRATMGEEGGNSAAVVALRKRILRLRHTLGDLLPGGAICARCGCPVDASAAACPHCGDGEV
jgi:RsiW-degrading membrane proteinase PrsW (M82 family)